jgi:septum formation protein
MLVLASASPRRHELLLLAGIPHLVRPSSIPEVHLPGESPPEFVRRTAEEKALAVHRNESEVILAADTAVAVDGHTYGKPSGPDDAVRMLRTLSGREHSVYTGICLQSATRLIRDVVETKVTFLPLSEQEIQEYTRSGEPFDKAGAYAIQGLASKFVSRVVGCYHNVVGLPVSLVYTYLKTL